VSSSVMFFSTKSMSSDSLKVDATSATKIGYTFSRRSAATNRSSVGLPARSSSGSMNAACAPNADASWTIS
jgi:hypothetical protein